MSFIIWQLFVLWLVANGVFLITYGLLGIPWNTLGVVNVVGTTIGWITLEAPWILYFSASAYSRRKSRLPNRANRSG